MFCLGCYGHCPISQSDNADLQACLEPFKNAFQEVSRIRPNSESSVFPLLFMSPSDLRPLCKALERAKSGCSFDLQDCDTDPLVDFANKNLRFVCAKQPKEFVVKNCIYFVVQNNTKCQSILRSKTKDTCDTIFDFYNCVENDLSDRCGTDAVATLVKAVTGYGCSNKALAEKCTKYLINRTVIDYAFLTQF
ncbi:unnamed protein product [Soboliphyme baturini]|uniref:DUF19 domain-containing protein n=1 Tax=Soboliphyme baturini TaxID=241478 RepID=A0A183I9M0_9BILA|nr:unnamed protein product [Soboliphyme baturini]